MRDVILFLVLAGIIPLIIRAPIVGIIAWIWITLMNPQREVYGFLSGFELNFYVAALTFLAWFASKERKSVPLNGTTIALIVFAIWASFTTYMAIDRNFSFQILDRTLKTIALALAVVVIVDSKSRVQAIVWAVAISLGYYAVKGGGFALLTGVRSRVFGPEDTMIADNNALGLALVVLLPLLNYLRLTSRDRIVRWALLGTIGLTFLAIIATYSRGALLALGAAMAVYAIRSRAGILLLFVGALAVATLPAFMPSGWMERMGTIQNYSEDSSFEGRVSAWRTSTNVALARPLTGGGFSAIELDKVAAAHSSPGSLKSGKAAHSVYFQVLGDHGFIGLALYLVLVGTTWLNTFSVLNRTRGRPDLLWANHLARMLQVSLLAFLVGGAALSMAYYDGFIILFALTAALLQVVQQPATARRETGLAPRWKRTRPGALTPGATSVTAGPDKGA